MTRLFSRYIFVSSLAVVLFANHSFCKDKDNQSKEGQTRSAVQQAPADLPGDWNSAGGRLYLGDQTFTNGGASCISCHKVRGRHIIASLDKIIAKKSGDELSTFLLKPNNIAMKMAYGKHPLTGTEAAAIRDYFASITDEMNASKTNPTDIAK